MEQLDGSVLPGNVIGNWGTGRGILPALPGMELSSGDDAAGQLSETSDTASLALPDVGLCGRAAEENGICTVAVIGFERGERRVLRRALSLSEDRSPVFRPFDKTGGGWPDLVIVDADRPSALQTWNRFRRANSHRASFAPIFVSDSPKELPCPDPYVLHRPILASNVVTLLDKAVADVHGFRPPAVHTHGAGARAGSGAVNALVVERNFPVRVQLRRALSRLVTHVDFADTGVQAVQRISARPYSVVFLDVGLPHEDAYEVCGLIKQHPLQHGVTVIMLTTSSSPAEQVMGMLAGFDNYLVKPLKPGALAALASQWPQPAAVI